MIFLMSSNLYNLYILLQNIIIDMKVLKYESFLETMQFAALSNAQKLAKEEEDRRKKKQEQEKTDSSKETNTQDKPVYHGEEEMEEDYEE